MDRELFLKELKLYWLQNEVPNISETNAKFLRDLIKIKKPTNFLEIWTANWYSTINFAIELEKIWWKIDSIEFSKLSHEKAIENIKACKLENTVNLICWNALDEISKLEKKYDFIFIDWMKRRSLDFLKLSLEKAKSWTVIILDDVIKFSHKMIWLKEFLEENNIKNNIIPIDIDDGIMVIIVE